MKKLLSLIFAIGLSLSACETARTQVVFVAKTSTPPLPPTASQTHIPSTPTVTPLPTIPTFTPTFDASTIVTVTPAEKAECPRTITIENPNMDLLEKPGFEKNALDFLNKYDPLPLLTAIQNLQPLHDYVANQDFTNDGSPEVAVGIAGFYIFGCKNGHYETLLRIPPDGYSHPAQLFSIKDNNRDGVPEITLLTVTMSQGGHLYEVYEWDGENFTNLLPPYSPQYSDTQYLKVEATGEIHYEDVDNDNVQELILDSGVPVWETYHAGLPWRNKTTYYKWNGQYYLPSRSEFANPEFRFQAIQDGDLALSQKEVNKALSLYESAIVSNNLKSYSLAIRANLQEAAWFAQIEKKPIPTPRPEDPTEYPRLAAYAYYRIMLLYLAQGQGAKAASTYQTVQETFGGSPYAAPYLEMATAFWETYQSTQKMYDGCASAIQYAAEHPEILIPLGSDYHGWQSHRYEPADVCPFR